MEQGRLIVILSDPTDEKTLAALRLAAGMDLALRIAPDRQLLAAIDKLERVQSQARPPGGTAPGEAAEAGDGELAPDAPVIDLLNRLFREALAQRAAGLHFEPVPGHVIVRRRLDGVMTEIERLPPPLGRAAILRLKLLAHLDGAQNRLPQDGRARFRLGDTDYDIRAATLPTIHGESIAIRFLKSSRHAPELKQLGLGKHDIDRLKRELGRSQGLIIVTGPAGSGRTATLAAALNHLADPARKTVAIEEAAEYQQEGVSHIEVHPETGLTFAKALRAALKADPDVLLVGEIRDPETAVLAVNAALTGRLVLAAMTAPSAAGAILRLIDLGAAPYLVAAALRCVVAQRLVRKLCARCREPHEAPRELVEQLAGGAVPVKPGAIKLWRAKGCSHCGASGYSGRTGIFEVLAADENMQRLIRPEVTADAIVQAARRAGMDSIMADGFRKCIDGITTIEELGRVTADD
jgi:general secretion pathway protein E